MSIKKRCGKHVGYCLLCFVWLTCSASCCVGERLIEHTMRFVNGTTECVYVSKFSDYPDLLYPEDVLFDGIGEMLVIEPGKEVDFTITALLDEGYDHNVYLQSLMIRQSTLEKYGLDEIIKQGIYDRRFLYTYRELEGMGFIFVIEDEEYE